MLNLDFKNYMENLNEMNSAGSYSSRISQGKEIEINIREAMKRDMQWITVDSSSQDDMYNGIDCWVVSKDGGKTKNAQQPIQIKARKNASGNDILWETIKPWNQNTATAFHERPDSVYTGKDMKCKADLILSVSNDGYYLRFRKVSETIQIAKQMAKELVEVYMSKGFKIVKTKWGEARILKDPSQEATYNQRGNIYKVNCFIMPNSYEWKQDVKLTKPIGAV